MASMSKSSFGRRLAVAGVAAATALALAACGGSPSPEETDAGATPVQGGDLTILAAGNIASWDPIVNAQGSLPGVATDNLIAVYGVLLYVDEQGDVQPGIAESLTTDDAKVWTLTLREGVTFTDGTPFDAEAVKYNWDRAAGDGSALKGVASTFESEVVDDLTLEITLDNANPVFDRRVAEVLEFIASPTALEEQGAEYVDPVGAGPFVLETWEQNVGQTFSRNDDYYEEGKPYVDTLTISIVADPAQRVTTVAQGGANIMNGYSFQWVSETGNDAVAAYPVPAGGIRHIVFNTTSAPFDNVDARRAVALAVDSTELVTTLTQDPTQIGGSTLFSENAPYADDALVPATGDVDAAKDLVAELTADGVDLSNVTILAAAVPELIRSAELLQLQLDAAGIGATVEQIPIQDWRARAFDQDNYDITFYPGVFDLNNAAVGMANLFGPGGTDNFANFDDADMNAAIEAAQDATDADAQAAAFTSIQEVYADQVPILVFGIDYRAFFHTADLDGFTTMGRGALLTQNLFFPASED